ncbi:hypothetical protein E1176_08900 [Fulvivirga sp. RKSG066]|uniref:hypothetical protein n=1 Tax=Fulvivirga aurantia TaxID=2529383 RepID=UPI0012BC5CFE|nr:hypothetical protein [Fulvivirga aurantia]MTI21136.1 hypothetical protein [Fulvivirga aurantia]
MKSYLIYVIGLIVVICGCDNESNVNPNFEDYFLKYYGQDGSHVGVDVAHLEDGFILLGTKTSNANTSIFVVRTDELGNQLWQLEAGGNSATANALQVDNAGNFIIAGTHNVSTIDDDIVILKINSGGELTDSISVGITNEIEKAEGLTIANNGDVIVIGSTTGVDENKPGYVAATDLEDIYSVRIGTDFTPLTEADWRRVSGFPGVERGVDIAQKSDDTFLFFGTTDRPPSSSQKDGFNMFLYPAGNDGEAISVTQLQLFGTLSNEMAAQMTQTSDGGFIMIGTTGDSESSDIFLARVRSSNEFLSSGSLNTGKSINGISVTESNTGGFYVVGREITNNTGDIYLAKTSISGSVLWERSFGGVDNDYPGKVIELEDGSIVIVGTADLESQTKMSLIKTNSRGELKP